MKDFNQNYVNLKYKSYKNLLNHINNRFNTLPFCDKWLYQDSKNFNYKLALEKLCDIGIIKKYPPLYDKEGSFVSQYEHTIILKPTAKEVLTKSSDY